MTDSFSVEKDGNMKRTFAFKSDLQKVSKWGAPSSAGMCPPRTPALLRGAGTILKSAKTGAIEVSASLSSAGSGTTDDRLLVQCKACLRGTNVHTKRTRTGVLTGVDMSRKVRDSRTKPSTVQVVVHIHLD